MQTPETGADGAGKNTVRPMLVTQVMTEHTACRPQKRVQMVRARTAEPMLVTQVTTDHGTQTPEADLLSNNAVTAVAVGVY
jgi:hypothetical protein